MPAMATSYCVVLVTVPDHKTAGRVARRLLNDRLAACVNEIPGAHSSYWWENRIETAKEILLMIKTRSALIPEVVRCVRKNHPYTVPEIIGLPIIDGHKEYLAWVRANTPASSGRGRRISRAPGPSRAKIK